MTDHERNLAVHRLMFRWLRINLPNLFVAAIMLWIAYNAWDRWNHPDSVGQPWRGGGAHFSSGFHGFRGLRLPRLH